jgi:DNA repair protein RecN (Recombination protein N)
MLNTLTIHNFTLIMQAEIEFTPHMTVLTGETGAGKSILIDALALVLGGRAEGSIQHKKNELCELFANFDLTNRTDIQSWLQQHDLEKSQECIFRRTFTKDGRSRCYINGKPSPVNQVRELGQLLLNIHGQNEQQLLQLSEHQRYLLDQYGEHLKLSQQVKQIHHDFEAVNAKIQLLQQQEQERLQRLEFLRFQLQELEHLHLSLTELENLEQSQKRLAHMGSLINQFDEALALCEQDNGKGLVNQLYQLEQLLRKIQAIEPTLKPALECVQSAQIHIQETYRDLQHYAESLDMEPDALEKTETRLRAIYDMARKHRLDPKQLPALQKNLEKEIAQLTHHDEYLEGLTKQAQTLLSQYHTAATELSRKRKIAAEQLIPQINDNLKLLNMPHCLFDIAFEPLESKQIASFGLENITFMIRPNPGQPFNALSKIASGGELSRICLSIQAIIATKHATPTLIFDEIDTGVGGNSADMIGTLLKKLSEKTQVICITHLAQVASKADAHLRIEKHHEENNTITRIYPLNKTARIEEIARMVGGATITAKTKAHAKELLESDG